MLNAESSKWLANFERENGRPLRVLHIGNIANNAYLNSKFLRAVGVESDVLCYDYYHIMGCPEWEDGRIAGAFLDPVRPLWYLETQTGFSRPKWFVQGPLGLCLDYFLAFHGGKSKEAKQLWERLAIENGIAPKLAQMESASQGFIKYLKNKGLISKFQIFLFDKGIANKLANAFSGDFWLASPLRELLARVGGAIFLLISIPLRLYGILLEFLRNKGAGRPSFHSLQSAFNHFFPERTFSLKETDISIYASVLERMAAVFEHYDLVQGYATDGVYPMLVGKKYVAFEHGTIRNIPFEDTVQGRLCALTYRMADAVVITNADNLLAARKLKLERFSFVPHPVNDFGIETKLDQAQDLRQTLMNELGVKFLLFHPARQHWDDQRHPDWEKGNDFLIHGLARLINENGAKVGAVFVDWGQSVVKSKELLSSLGIDRYVKWIQPQAHQSMLDYVVACDVLADQFFLGAFGSTLPKALMCGRPALIYLNEELHAWCFPDMPPVINAHTADEIFAGLAKLYDDKEYCAEIGRAGSSWYQKWHSSDCVVNTLLAVYQGVLEHSNA